jgi:hypothetical protein
VALTLAKTLRLLAAEKKAVLQRQTALVANLNKLLPSIGYRVVPLESEGRMDVRPTPRGVFRAAPVAVKPLGHKPLVCSHCDRTFALPLHLGRHISVMHKEKSAGTTATHSPAGRERPGTPKATRTPRGQVAGRHRRVRSPRTTGRKTSRKTN